MEIALFFKEDGEFRHLDVPLYVVKDLLCDRLSKSEMARIHRLADKKELPEKITPGTVVADFDEKTAQFYQVKINVEHLEPTWNVTNEKITLLNY